MPTSGSLSYLDLDLTDYDDSKLTQYRLEHVGFIFQFYNLIPSLTARENVALVTEIAKDPMKPEDALAMVDMSDRMNHFPAQLSGGELQWVAVARAIAKRPDVGVGDTISVHIREGRKPTVELPVVELIETYIDLPVYMHLTSLNRLLLQSSRAASVSVLIDKNLEGEFYRELKNTPKLATVMLREAAVANFNKTAGETIRIFVGFFGTFAAALGFGVVYNSARITLSERGRELASLRVLGFSRAAISYILLGEVGLLILIALPIGCLIGWSLAWFIVTTAFSNELFRLPLVIYPSSYGIAILVTLASAALVRRRLDKLDLISVLKTRE